MHEMSLMGAAGDTTVTWDPAVEEEVTEAKRIFDEMIAHNYPTFKVENKVGERIQEFDPQAEKILVTPPMAGGC